MSWGSAPTVLASTSVVSTSHSFCRFGYCCPEVLLRGTSPAPAFTAVPPTDLVQPVDTDNAVANTATLTRTRRRTVALLICRSQSFDAPALWRYCRRRGTASG